MPEQFTSSFIFTDRTDCSVLTFFHIKGPVELALCLHSSTKYI